MSKNPINLKSFLRKLVAAKLKCGSVDKLYATLFRADIEVSIKSINRWLTKQHAPHPNNIKIVEPELDKILAAR